MERDELAEYIKLCSIPLRKLDENKTVIGSASGCLIDYLGKRILLSVYHATSKGNWAAEVKYTQANGMELHGLNDINYIIRTSISDPSDRKDVDFSYVEVPNNFISYYQEIDLRGKILNEQPRKISKPLFDSSPSASEKYGFAGQVLIEYVAPGALLAEMRLYTPLSYLGKEDDYHVFALPFKHPGHEHFQGCSGAPIIDSQGNAVALVSRGCDTENKIYGISLEEYKFAIDSIYGIESSSA